MAGKPFHQFAYNSWKFCILFCSAVSDREKWHNLNCHFFHHPLCLPGILLLLLISCGEKKQVVTTPSSASENFFIDRDFSKIENGDIILKHGKGSLSNMIAKKLNEKIPFSHCGILVRQNEYIYIIHSLAKEVSGIDGVQKVGFERFTQDCLPNSMYIVRYKGDTLVRNKIADNAWKLLNNSIPFDYDLNYTDPSRMNCSEMVYHIMLNTTGRDLFEKILINNKMAFSFNSLLDSSDFEIIYNY